MNEYWEVIPICVLSDKYVVDEIILMVTPGLVIWEKSYLGVC